MEEKDLETFGDKLVIGKTEIKIVAGFCLFSRKKLENLSTKLSLSIDDLLLIQDYYKSNEKRDPSETELKLLETY
jgi:phosphoribosylformylglycinamidine synthase